MNWDNWFKFSISNIEESKKCPLTMQMLGDVFKKIESDINGSDPFSKALTIERIATEMPDHIAQAKKYASPMKEEELSKWKLFLEIVISKDYDTLPEKINLARFKPTLEEYILIITRLLKKEEPKKIRPENLFDIWEGDLNSYENIINHLKKKQTYIDGPFVIQTKNKLTWLKKPQKGWVQYLAGFIYICIQKNWIQDSYSANEYKFILENTFNVTFSPNPFKGLTGTPPKNEYLTPFRLLPANLNM